MPSVASTTGMEVMLLRMLANSLSVVRFEVLDEQEGQSRAGEGRAQQLLGECFLTRPGSADADDRKVMFVG